MADFLIPLLLGGGLGAGSWLLNQIPGLGPKTTNVNTDYTNNPIWQQMFGSGGGYANAQTGMADYLAKMGGSFGKMDTSLGDMSSFIANAVSTAKSYDPNAFWKDFMAAQPEMQSLISGPTGSFKAASEANLADFVKEATSGTASELSGMGALYSGAMPAIAGQKIGAEAGKSATDLASLQASLMSQLWGSMLPQFSGNEQFASSNLVNTYLGGASSSLGAANAYGSQANTYLGGANTYASQMATMLGLGGDLSSPLYVQSPGFADSLMSGLGLGLQGASAWGMLGGKGTTSPAVASPSLFKNPTQGNPNYGGAGGQPNFTLYPKTGYWPN